MSSRQSPGEMPGTSARVMLDGVMPVFQSKTEDIRKKIKNEISRETYRSLEEIFLDVVLGNGEDHAPGKLS